MNYLLTKHGTHLKTNLIYLIPHLTDKLKLNMTSDTNQKNIVFSYHFQTFETIIHYIELNENWSHSNPEILGLTKLRFVSQNYIPGVFFWYISFCS